MIRVLIAIQARSTSTRLPGKAFEMIGPKPMIDHVLDACRSAAHYLNRYQHKTGYGVEVALLVPTGDQIAEKMSSRCLIFQGPEHDVLTRFNKAAAQMSADYVVRVTGDCPLISPFLISKHIKIAIANGYDYISNVYEGMRTAIDGLDCEVISRRLLEHLHADAKEAFDREHVTTLARRSPPSWAKMGCIIGYFDHSDVKLSVDTQEDLARVLRSYDGVAKKLLLAERTFGKHAVHRV